MPRTLRPSGWVLGLTTVALVAAAGTVGVSLVVRDAAAEPASPSGETPYWERGRTDHASSAPQTSLFRVAPVSATAAPAPVAPASTATLAPAPAATAAPVAPVATPAASPDQLAQAPAVDPNVERLDSVIAMNHEGYKVISDVRDYTCLFVKRERVNNKLTDYTHMQMKLRHEPFSVYLRFVKPADVDGREVIYVHGKNDNKMLAHSTGFQKLVGTLTLDPTGPYAMEGNAYPITAAGIKNLLERMIPAAQDDRGRGETDVQFFKGAKVDGRPCTCVQIVHPVRRQHFTYYISRCYYDDEFRLPVRTELYDWPQRAGGQPEMVGEYTYTQLKFNVGLTDYDFDVRNKSYDF